MTAYKLFKLRKNGTIGPLFINARQEIALNRWLEAEDHPTKGFAHRPGWHCCLLPDAPHLVKEPASGPRRVWARVEVEDFKYYHRPKSQGGKWLLAQRMRVVELIE